MPEYIHLEMRQVDSTAVWAPGNFLPLSRKDYSQKCLVVFQLHGKIGIGKRGMHLLRW
ncbi:hypothetical protein D3C86_2130030 [compost metagenome]